MNMRVTTTKTPSAMAPITHAIAPRLSNSQVTATFKVGMDMMLSQRNPSSAFLAHDLRLINATASKITHTPTITVTVAPILK
jgi:hypothetical protein